MSEVVAVLIHVHIHNRYMYYLRPCVQYFQHLSQHIPTLLLAGHVTATLCSHGEHNKTVVALAAP